jgi:acetyl esterase/lipase
LTRVLQILTLGWLSFALAHVAYTQRPTGPLLSTNSVEKKEQVDITKKNQWNQKRQDILGRLELVMGKLPPVANLPLPAIQYLDTLKENTYTRYKIQFAPAPNEVVHAFLYRPNPRPGMGKRPAMLALHPTGMPGKLITDGQGTQADPIQRKNRSYGKELAERGFVVIAPDYPSFGDAKDHDFAADRYESGTMKAIFDNIRCIDLLQSLDDVDPESIGVIGHSLGGHNAMFTAAFDQRLKVVVSSCGWTMLDYYDLGVEASKPYGGRLGPFAQDRYMPLFRTKFGLNPELIPFDFDEIIAAIAPRGFFSSSPLADTNFDYKGVIKGIESAASVYKFLNAENRLVVKYPNSTHDFPYPVRQEAYQFIDSILLQPTNNPKSKRKN